MSAYITRPRAHVPLPPAPERPKPKCPPMSEAELGRLMAASAKAEGKQAILPPGVSPKPEPKRTTAQVERLVLTFIQQNPGSSSHAIYTGCGIRAITFATIIKSLIDRELVRTERVRKERANGTVEIHFLTPVGREFARGTR